MAAFVLPLCRILGVIFLSKKDCWVSIGLSLEGNENSIVTLCKSFGQFGRKNRRSLKNEELLFLCNLFFGPSYTSL